MVVVFVGGGGGDSGDGGGDGGVGGGVGGGVSGGSDGSSDGGADGGIGGGVGGGIGGGVGGDDGESPQRTTTVQQNGMVSQAVTAAALIKATVAPTKPPLSQKQIQKATVSHLLKVYQYCISVKQRRCPVSSEINVNIKTLLTIFESNDPPKNNVNQ